MHYTSEAIEKLIAHFSALPSIGKKTAQRLTYHLLRQPDEFLHSFSESLAELKTKVTLCSKCYNYTDSDPCSICSSTKRDNTIICVVEEPNDLLAIEKTNEYKGLYHVLHGVLNPIDGIGPGDIKIKELLERLLDVDEVILALNPSVESEVTTQYLVKLLKQLDIKITRIARGVPIGTSLEFTDEATLSRAISGRTSL